MWGGAWWFQGGMGQCGAGGGGTELACSRCICPLGEEWGDLSIHQAAPLAPGRLSDAEYAQEETLHTSFKDIQLWGPFLTRTGAF